jgi:predicted methyltransferase
MSILAEHGGKIAVLDLDGKLLNFIEILTFWYK